MRWGGLIADNADRIATLETDAVPVWCEPPAGG
jgi:hypothetical protein